MDDSRLLEQFVAEAEEILESLRADLDDAERRRAAGRVPPDLLNRVFRSAHSLKGIAGMAGVAPVQAVAHRFEDLLDDLRMGRLVPGEGTFAGGLEVVEGLAALVAAAARGLEAEGEAERLLSRVEALRAGEGPEAASGETALVDLDDRARQTLTEYEEHRLAENVRERRPVYLVSVSFHVTEFDRGYRAFSAQLGEQGEVVCTLPAPGGDDPLQIGFRIVVASDAPRDRLELLAREHGGSVDVISRYPEPAPVAEPGAPEEGRGAGEALDGMPASVRVDVRELEALANLAQDLALRVSELAAEAGAHARRLGLGAREEFDVKQRARAIERGFAELEERIVDLRLVPLAQAFSRARRLVLATAAELGREVELETEGEEVRLDKAIVDRVAEPLAHLLRNAVDHGVEPPEEREAAGKPRAGRVLLRAEPRGNRVCITVSDDGPGIDAEAVRRAALARGIEPERAEGPAEEVIFEPGLSTAESVSAISGRGVGLDAVADVARGLGGGVAVESERGRGAAFHLTLPSTLVMISALFVEAAGAAYAVDVNQIEELASFDLRPGDPSVEWREQRLPLYDMARLVRARATGELPGGAVRPCLMARVGERHVAVAVDRLVGQREVVVKSLGRFGPSLRGVAGAVDLEGGRVALLVDLPSLVASEARAGAGRAR